MYLIKTAGFILLIMMLISCETKVGNFTATTPTGWTIKDSTTERYGRSVTMYPPATAASLTFIESISISSIKFISTDVYITYVLQEVEKSSLAFKLKDRGDLKIKDSDFQWINLLLKNKDSLLIEQKAWFIKEGGNVYQIIYTTKANEQDKYQKELEQVLQSFKILH